MSTSPTSSHCTFHPVALVTGSAADRVGRVVAKRLADSGYRIVLHSHHDSNEGRQLVADWQKHGIESMLVQGPIEDPSTIDRWMESILQRFHRLDAVVHSAAIWEPTPLETMSIESLRHHWEVNQLGPMLICQKAGLHLVSQSTGGSIVLVGDWAIERPYRDFAAYFASKGSIPTIVRTMAIELASRNPKVRVNAVMPGPIMLYPTASQELRDSIRNQALVKREGTAEDLARACQFLLEQPFITGTCLPVDGGRSVYGSNVSDAVAHRDYLASGQINL